MNQNLVANMQLAITTLFTLATAQIFALLAVDVAFATSFPQLLGSMMGSLFAGMLTFGGALVVTEQILGRKAEQSTVPTTGSVGGGDTVSPGAGSVGDDGAREAVDEEERA